MKQALLAWACLFAVCTAPALEFSEAVIGGQKATVIRVNVATDKLQLFLRDEHGAPLKSFEGIDRWLAPRGQKLAFGMNAGMFHGDLLPVGLCIIGGRQIAPLNLAAAPGNFSSSPTAFSTSRRPARMSSSRLPSRASPSLSLSRRSPARCS